MLGWAVVPVKHRFLQDSSTRATCLPKAHIDTKTENLTDNSNHHNNLFSKLQRSCGHTQ